MNQALTPLGRMAREIKVPQRWLREQAESGIVPALKAGGRWLFDPQTVRRVVSSLAKEGNNRAKK